jgi:Transposase C of IS166 homeodomain
MNLTALQQENERLKALLAQTQAALAEHQAALVESEEARRRLEIIVGQLNHEKFGAKSEKLHPDQYHLPLEDVEIAQGVLDAAQEKAQRIIQGVATARPVLAGATAVTCLPICRGWSGSSSPRARCARAAVARWPGSART